MDAAPRRTPGELEPAKWRALRKYETGDAEEPGPGPILAVTRPYTAEEITRLAPTCYADTYLVWLTPDVTGRYRVGTAKTRDLAAWLWPDGSGPLTGAASSTAAGTGDSPRLGGRVLSVIRRGRLRRLHAPREFVGIACGIPAGVLFWALLVGGLWLLITRR